MNKLTKRAKIITGEVVLRGFRELARDDVLSRVDFDELACQIFDDSAFDTLQEELPAGESFFSPEIDGYIDQVSEAIDGIEEDTWKALSSREGIRNFKIAQDSARQCVPLLEHWLALNSSSGSHVLAWDQACPAGGGISTLQHR